MNKLSTERAIEVLNIVRAYYAGLTVGYPKGKDCKGIGDVMCSEIANSCLMAIKALKEQENSNSIRINFVGEEEAQEFKKYLKNQQPCEDCISRYEALNAITMSEVRWQMIDNINKLPSVTPQQKVGKWIAVENDEMETIGYYCSECDLPMETEYRTNFCPQCGSCNGGNDNGNE